MATSLNVDCWLLVLKAIPTGDRVRCRRVCHQWRDLIDYLSFSQKALRLVSSHSPPSTTTHDSRLSPSSSTFIWPHQNISYSEFVSLFTAFPRLRTLAFTGFTHWNDHHLIRLTELCPTIDSLAFYSCQHLNENYFNDFGFQNLTAVGWQILAKGYTGLRSLILEDCDLENYHLELIVTSFRQLCTLNIANNSEITKFSALTNLPSTLEELRLGPKLSVDFKKNRALFNHEMPIDALVSNSGLKLRCLQLQGCLSPKLTQLKHLPSLETLILKYASFSSVEDIFTLETEILTSTASHLKQLKALELYQINQCSTMDLHWLRQRLSSVTVSNSLKSNLPNLATFTLHSTDPLIVVEQFRLVDFILASTPNLTSISLSCATFDTSLHYNLNQTILVLLQKYGSTLQSITLENLFPTCLFSYLSYVILTCPRLRQFTLDDREMVTFLYCMDAQIDQLISNGKLTHQDRLHPLDLTFTAASTQRIDRNRLDLSLTEINYLHSYVKVAFTADQADARLRAVDMSSESGLTDTTLSSSDSDLSDLCQLIDSSCELVNHALDLVTHVSNYLALTVACLLFLRPSHLGKVATRWLFNRGPQQRQQARLA